MIVSWGGFSFDDNECWFEIEKKPLYSKIGQRRHQVERWTITGVRHGPDTATIVSKIAALEAAVQDDYRDLKFSSGHELLNANTISGTKVEDFRWLSGIQYGDPGSAVELVVRRTFRLIIRGEVLDSENDVVEWHESIRTIGTGGIRWKMMGSLTGPVQLQETQLYTPYTAIQSGYAVGHGAYPIAATPLWIGFEHEEQRDQWVGTPRFNPIWNTDYPIRWRYVFESATALIGGPTLYV